MEREREKENEREKDIEREKKRDFVCVLVTRSSNSSCNMKACCIFSPPSFHCRAACYFGTKSFLVSRANLICVISRNNREARKAAG